MNDKIKEILDNIKNKYDSYLVCDIVSGDDLKLLLDYINKLQSNWNSLKEELYQANRELVYNELVNGRELINNILNKMNELEGKDKEK